MNNHIKNHHNHENGRFNKKFSEIHSKDKKFKDNNSFYDFEDKILKYGMHGMIKKKMVTMVILWTITKEKTYGYDLIKKLNENWCYGIDEEKIDSEKTKKKPFGSNRIYPILKILEKEDLIEGTWEKEGKRKIKYYEATEKGIYTIKRFKKMKPNAPPIFKEFLKDILFDDENNDKNKINEVD